MAEIDYSQMSDAEAKEYFNKNYNIGYVDESLPTPPNEVIFKHYVASALVYGLALLFFLFNPFYVEYYKKMEYMQEFALYLYLGYLFLAPIFLWTLKPRTVYVSHSVEVVNYLLKLIKREGLVKGANSVDILKWIIPTYKQKQALILFFIKFFFAPQMCIWAINHFNSTGARFNELKTFHAAVMAKYTYSQILDMPKLLLKYRDSIFLIACMAMYFLDVFVYTIGYCTELTFLKNRIRTVECTGVGLVFCLLCYPVLNITVSNVLHWHHDELNFNGVMPSDPLNVIVWICMAIAFFFLIIYVSASVALFTRASNLTNRGTVCVFPYNIIRHPAYSAKISMWIMGSIALARHQITTGQWGLFVATIIGGFGWAFIYYMRAITEERHLMHDPDYRAYMKKVKWKFIPGLW